MTLRELKTEVDRLIAEGHGECEIYHSRGSYMTYFDEIFYDEDEDEIVID